MVHSHTLLSLLVAGSGLVSCNSMASRTNSTINWFSCQQNASMPVTCGSLDVPLDYTDPHSRMTINVQLTKFNATKKPVKGSILVNPGGPGESAREFLAGYAQEMMIATSGHYNLIAFETRGVGDTLPFSCFDSEAERTALLSSALPSTPNNSDTSLGMTWSVGTVVADACYKKNKDIGSYMSTAFIARDMMQIVDALGEDGLLRFYGFSYGTVLGATAAAMFPDRIEKMVLDGVVNVPQWLYGSNEELSLQADAAMRAFFQSCLEEQDSCAIQRQNQTADELYDQVMNMLEEIKYHPLVLDGNGSSSSSSSINSNSIVQYGTVKPAIYILIKTGMELARPLATYLNAILEKNATAYTEILALIGTSSSSPIYPNHGPEALYGIQCPDSQFRSKDIHGMQSIIDHEYSQSYYAGPFVVTLASLCAQWKMSSRESFRGPFRANLTRSPILFISSPLDPATPMASARNMTQGFPGSALLQQNGIGHCSLAQPSTCTIQATIAYFLNTTLPSNGTICEPDFGFFTNHTILDVYKMAAK